MTTQAGHPASLTQGTVLIYAARKLEPEHERAVHFQLGRRIAALLGAQFGGAYLDSARYETPVYLIPTDTDRKSVV